VPSQPGYLNVAGESFFLSGEDDEKNSMTSNLDDDSAKGDKAFQALFLEGFDETQQKDLRRIFRSIFGITSVPGAKGIALPCKKEELDLLLRAIIKRRDRLADEIINYQEVIGSSDLHIRYLHDHLTRLDTLIQKDIPSSKAACKGTDEFDASAVLPSIRDDEQMMRLLKIFAFLLAQGKDPVQELVDSNPEVGDILSRIDITEAPLLETYEDEFKKERPGKEFEYLPTLVKIKKVLNGDCDTGTDNADLLSTFAEVEKILDLHPTVGTDWKERKRAIIIALNDFIKNHRVLVIKGQSDEAELARVRAELARVKAELAKCQEENRTCNEQLEILKKRVLELEAELAAAKAALAAALAAQKAAKDEIERLRRDCQDPDKIRKIEQDLEARILAIDEDMARKLQQLIEMHAKLSPNLLPDQQPILKIALDQRIAELKKEAEGKKDDISKSRAKLIELYNQFIKHLGELQEKAAAAGKIVEDANARIAELEAELAKLRAQIAELQAELARLQAQNATLEQMNRELQGKLEKCTEENKRIRAEFERILAEKDKIIAEKEKIITEKEQEILGLQGQLAAVKRLLTDVWNAIRKFIKENKKELEDIEIPPELHIDNLVNINNTKTDFLDTLKIKKNLSATLLCTLNTVYFMFMGQMPKELPQVLSSVIEELNKPEYVEFIPLFTKYFLQFILGVHKKIQTDEEVIIVFNDFDFDLILLKLKDNIEGSIEKILLKETTLRFNDIINIPDFHKYTIEGGVISKREQDRSFIIILFLAALRKTVRSPDAMAIASKFGCPMPGDESLIRIEDPAEATNSREVKLAKKELEALMKTFYKLPHNDDDDMRRFSEDLLRYNKVNLLESFIEGLIGQRKKLMNYLRKDSDFWSHYRGKDMPIDKKLGTFTETYKSFINEKLTEFLEFKKPGGIYATFVINRMKMNKTMILSFQNQIERFLQKIVYLPVFTLEPFQPTLLVPNLIKLKNVDYTSPASNFRVNIQETDNIITKSKGKKFEYPQMQLILRKELAI